MVDSEEVFLFCMVLFGFVGAILLLRLRWKRLFIGLVIFVWVGVVSSVTEHIARAVFHDFQRGTMFSRAFLLIGIAFIAYLIYMMYTRLGGDTLRERIPSPIPLRAHRVRQQQPQAQQSQSHKGEI